MGMGKSWWPLSRLLTLYRDLMDGRQRVVDRLEAVDRQHVEISKDLGAVKSRVDPLVELVMGMRSDGHRTRPRQK